MPDYRRRVRPLLSLLSSRSTRRWTLEHTSVANKIAMLIQQRIQLGLVDYTLPGRLHIDVDE